MGKGKRHRPGKGGKGGHGKGGKGDGQNKRHKGEGKGEGRDSAGYRVEEYSLTNATMEEYYKTVWPAEEYDEILACLRTTLPTTFRIGPNHGQVRDQLENEWLPKLAKISLDGGETLIEKPKPLPWYPERLAWHMNITKRQVKKDPLLKDFHEFLKRETDLGHISRQEAVSMIPVFFLDIEGHHNVLDMCAAPGMKTTQLLENLTLNSNEPSGVVVANDADRSRAFLLTHTLKRLRTPAFMVINHDARHVPTLKRPNKDEILFDRVLCDVPCSGDGTLRKSPDAWDKWTPAGGLNLHKIQVGIAMRGASLLKVGGMMVYSTCSFNPVENEAGVAEIIRLANGCLEIVDVADRLPHLKRAAGMHSWVIMGKDKKIYERFEDCENPREAVLLPSMFPPSAEEAKAMHLERCLRLVPSHQDTGGFFVAVLRKVKAFTMNPTKVQMVLARDPFAKVDVAMAESQEDKPADEEAATSKDDRQLETDEKKSDEICRVFEKFGRCKYGNECKFVHAEEAKNNIKAKSGTDGEEPLAQLIANHSEVFAKIKEAFGLDSFPEEQLFTRSTAALSLPRNIYYVSQSITDMISCDVRGRLKVINCGIKAFERVELKDPAVIAPYRICQEAILAMLPRVTKRKVKCGVKCIQSMLVKSNYDLENLDALDSDSEMSLMEQFNALTIGTIVIYAQDGDDIFAVSAFLGKKQLQLYVGKDEREVLKCQLLAKYGKVAEPKKQPTKEAKTSETAEMVEDDDEPTHVKFDSD